jgi:hypothetical protein
MSGISPKSQMSSWEQSKQFLPQSVLPESSSWSYHFCIRLDVSLLNRLLSSFSRLVTSNNYCTLGVCWRVVAWFAAGVKLVGSHIQLLSPPMSCSAAASHCEEGASRKVSRRSGNSRKFSIMVERVLKEVVSLCLILLSASVISWFETIF